MQKEQEHTLAAIRKYLTKNMPSSGKAILSYYRKSVHHFNLKK